MSLVCLVVVGFVVFGESDGLGRPDRSLFYSTTQFITAAGYPSQQHHVQTNDGYILGLFRIGGNSTGKRPPVLLMHGMTVASDSWLLQGPKKDLAYILYDAGYDVWLGDVRGNYYSRRHISLSPSNPKFWQYSFHEIGRNDLPALINTIIRLTGYRKINYVGHSMGTTSFFIMASEKPEMMSKINLFVGLSPVAAMDFKNFSPDKQIIFKVIGRLLDSFEQQGYYEILTRVWFAPYLSSTFCKEGSPTQSLCYDLVFFWAGSQTKRISKKALSRVLSHAPAGASVFTPKHYLQIIHSGRFGAMDLGVAVNQQRYNSANPPEYDLSRVTCPVSLHYSDGDYLINATDVRRNMKRMPNVVDVHEYKDFNHVDFVWGRTSYREVYVHVTKIMNKYNNRRLSVFFIYLFFQQKFLIKQYSIFFLSYLLSI